MRAWKWKAGRWSCRSRDVSQRRKLSYLRVAGSFLSISCCLFHNLFFFSGSLCYFSSLAWPLLTSVNEWRVKNVTIKTHAACTGSRNDCFALSTVGVLRSYRLRPVNKRVKKSLAVYGVNECSPWQPAALNTFYLKLRRPCVCEHAYGTSVLRDVRLISLLELHSFFFFHMCSKGTEQT